MPRHALLLLAAALAMLSPSRAEFSFDRPLSVETVTQLDKGETIPLSVTCWHYPAFMVVERYGDNAGMVQFGIERGKNKRCTVRSDKRQYLGWGARVGLKGRFLLIMQERFGKPVKYVYVVDTKADQLTTFALGGDAEEPLQSFTIAPDAVTARYRRTVGVPCSLYYGRQTACWSKLKADTGLTDERFPDCRSAYGARRKGVEETAEKLNNRNSRIAYPVEERFNGGKLTSTPLPGTVTCKPDY